MSKFSLNTLGKLLADKSGLSQVEAELFIRKMFDVCNQGLDADKQVKIKWLGTFKVQATKDRESINVNTGERFTIEGRDKLTFTPDNILKEIVKPMCLLSKTSQRWLRVSSGLGCHHLPIIKVIWWNCIQRAVVWKIFLVR